jgi:dihydrofolate synthase/folylpolyglutamate synthase
MRDLIAQLPEGDHPTFFEVVTIMALKWFAEQKCDIVIWETGLGGRLDATNIVTPLASVITNVQFDHEKWLGHTLAQIAFEKAGIIKPGVPVIAGVEMGGDAWFVILKIATQLGSLIENVPFENPDLLSRLKSKDLNLSLIGKHQYTNAALAIATAMLLEKKLRWGVLQSALKEINWPGRFDIRGRYILDGAHNPDGARTLRLTLEQTFPGLKPAFIVGILADKDIAAMAKEFATVASRIFTVAVQSDRSAEAEEIARQFRAVAPEVQAEACASLSDAIAKTENEDRVVITGSLHFIGEAMEHLGFEVGKPGERSLNDWYQNHDKR